MIHVRVHQVGADEKVVEVASLAEAEELVERWADIDGASAVIELPEPADELVIPVEPEAELLGDLDG